MRQIFNGFQLPFLMAILIISGQTFSMEFHEKEEDPGQKLLEIALSRFDSFEEAFNHVHDYFNTLKWTPEATGKKQGTKKKTGPHDMSFLKPYFEYFHWIAQTLDNFENGTRFDVQRKGQVTFRQAKEIHRALGTYLFGSALFPAKGKGRKNQQEPEAKPNKIQTMWVHKLEFMIFFMSTQNTDLLQAVCQSQVRKSRNSDPVVHFFIRQAGFYKLDVDDFKFLSIAKIYTRHKLAVIDDHADITSVFMKYYLNLRSFEEHKEKIMKTGTCEDCTVCLDDDMVCLSHSNFCTSSEGLDKKFCFSCLESYFCVADGGVNDLVKTNRFNLEIDCPASGCTSKFKTAEEWTDLLVKGLIQRETVVKILLWRLRTLDVSNQIHCANADCFNIIDISDEPLVTCNYCDALTCRGCKSFYTGSCCSNMLIIPKDCKIKQCPLCKTAVEKTTGCDYIKCPGCGGSFDVETGVLWTKEYANVHKNGSHSSSAMSEEKLRKIEKKLKKEHRLLEEKPHDDSKSDDSEEDSHSEIVDK